MQHKKNNTSMGQMIQRCHRWRQKRKQYLDQARQTSDEIDRERMLQMAEHYGRIVSDEQGKIDNTRVPGDRPSKSEMSDMTDGGDNGADDEDDVGFPDFLEQIK